jgi:hypothetical protein
MAEGVQVAPTPVEVENRTRKLRGWLAYLSNVWDQVEAESLAHGGYGGAPGFAEESERVCTCGRCGGRGCRFCRKGKVRITVRDAYKTDVSAGVAFKEKPDEGARLDAEIARLQRLARIRAGGEIREDKHLRLVRLHDHLTAREHDFLLRLERALDNGADLRDLAEHLPGRIPRPPKQYRGE